MYQLWNQFIIQPDLNISTLHLFHPSILLTFRLPLPHTLILQAFVRGLLCGSTVCQLLTLYEHHLYLLRNQMNLMT